MSIYREPVVYVDIETSGSNIERSKIIEIGVIRVEDGKIVDELKTLVNPGTSIPFWITKLTGITENDLVHAPYFEDIAYQLNQILDGAIFIAHHVRFDYSYIKRQLKTEGYDYNPPLLCTVRLSRALYPENKGHSLEKIISRHGIAVAARHRAYDDARAIKDFSELAAREKGLELFHEAVSKQLKTRSLPPNLDASYMENVTNKPGVYVFEDEGGSPLYIGKSVTLRNRVLSHYSQDTKLNREMKLTKGTYKLRILETKNELEALLLESRMVKELLPIYNKKLRRTKSHFVLLKDTDDNGYTTITIADKDLAREADLSKIYGMYASRAKAKAALEDKQKTYELCPRFLGLEKTKTACFQYQLGRCNGACTGKESATVHNQRVEIALERSRIESWPYTTPVAIGDGAGDHIVIDNWIVLGYLNHVEAAEPDFKPVERTFDLDTYRILRSYLSNNTQGLIITPFTPTT